MNENITALTLDTLIERINQMEEHMSIRLDRIESEVKLSHKLAHSQIYALRADFQQLHSVLKEHIPAIR